MNQIIFKQIVENKDTFVPYIISRKQMVVIEKVLNEEKLTKTEYNYLYNGIKKKMTALALITGREPLCYFYNPQNMIHERKQKAVELLEELRAKSKNAFVSGSFLFSEKYNDIDVYIISNKYKEEYRDNFHYIYIKQKDMEKPVFQAAAKSCISNVELTLPKLEIKKLNFGEIITTYQETIINILENEDTKVLKQIISLYSVYNLKKLLDSFELNTEYNKIMKRDDKISLISNMLKELVVKNFNKDYIRIKLTPNIKMLDEDIKNIKLNDHLKIYKKTYWVILNECK